jgi:hypothetical protein
MGRGVAEINPIVGAFNAGSQVISGKDAIDSHQLTTKQRMLSGVDIGLQGGGKVLKAGATVGAAVVLTKVADGAGDVNKVKRAANLLSFTPVIERGNAKYGLEHILRRIVLTQALRTFLNSRKVWGTKKSKA